MSPEYRIALFLPSATGGGAERVMLVLARAFAGEGIATDLVLAQDRDQLGASSATPNLGYVRLGQTRMIKAILPLARYLRRHRPDAMLTTLNYANVAAIVARRLSGTKTRLVLREATTLSRYDPSVNESGRDRMVQWLCARLYGAADGIIAVSRGVAGDVAENLGVDPDRISVIYNPLLAGEIRKRAAEPVSHPWFAPGAPPVIINVGRLSRQKDQALLMEAFGEVRSGQRARLAILGEGSQRAELETLARRLGIQDDVWLPGHVENPHAFLARSRVFALSSRVEGLPNVLLEAMVCGVPVVATNCPSGPAEILEDGKWGALVRPMDRRAMADAIRAVLERGPERIDYEPALQKYHLERVVGRYLSVLLPDIKSPGDKPPGRS